VPGGTGASGRPAAARGGQRGNTAWISPLVWSADKGSSFYPLVWFINARRLEPNTTARAGAGLRPEGPSSGRDRGSRSRSHFRGDAKPPTCMEVPSSCRCCRLVARCASPSGARCVDRGTGACQQWSRHASMPAPKLPGLTADATPWAAMCLRNQQWTRAGWFRQLRPLFPRIFCRAYPG
jgi:hypothetical protein